MGRRFSIPLAILLAGCLLLGGCSDPGPLPKAGGSSLTIQMKALTFGSAAPW